MTTKNFIQNSNATSHYTYNANGAMVTDANKSIVYTENFGYTKAAYSCNGSMIAYAYTADGQKLQTTHTTAVPNITVEYGATPGLADDEILSRNVTGYHGSIIYNNGTPSRWL